MLSYQHIYHAGNKADIQKHLWLITVLDYLRQKQKPFLWVDTHAGRGLYDLQSPEAQKLAEYKTGFLDLHEKLRTEKSLPAPLQIYKDTVRKFNTGDEVRFYPGSALIAAAMLRKDDKLFACDLHPQESTHLAQSLRNYKFAHAEKIDGYEKLLGTIPPFTKRGGALIDPSYEIKTEYKKVADTVNAALKKFPAGIYMIWYPMLKAGLHEELKHACNQLPHEYVIDEWIWGEPETTKGLYGSGMIIFNPPYTAVETMQKIKILFADH